MTEDEILELLLNFLPESWEGWLGTVIAIAAVLSLVLPAPAEDAHPAYRIGHRLICIFGLGVGKLKAAGKLGKIARIGSILKRTKP